MPSRLEDQDQDEAEDNEEEQEYTFPSTCVLLVPIQDKRDESMIRR